MVLLYYCTTTSNDLQQLHVHSQNQFEINYRVTIILSIHTRTTCASKVRLVVSPQGNILLKFMRCIKGVLVFFNLPKYRYILSLLTWLMTIFLLRSKFPSPPVPQPVYKCTTVRVLCFSKISTAFSSPIFDILLLYVLSDLREVACLHCQYCPQCSQTAPHSHPFSLHLSLWESSAFSQIEFFLLFGVHSFVLHYLLPRKESKETYNINLKGISHPTGHIFPNYSEAVTDACVRVLKNTYMPKISTYVDNLNSVIGPECDLS